MRPARPWSWLATAWGAAAAAGSPPKKLTHLAKEFWTERKGQLAQPEKDLLNFCKLVHERINEEGAKLGYSPRTTAVALYLTTSHAYWVHSGDSRLYHFRDRRLLERTEDHSFLEMMVQHGAVKAEDMGSHPEQSTLLQSLGGEEYAAPSVGSSSVTAADAFLLCTDGFWERTKPEEMIDLLYAESAGHQDRLEQAVTRAVERNGPKGDKETVAVVLPNRPQPAAPDHSGKRPSLVLIALILGLLGATGLADSSAAEWTAEDVQTRPAPNGLAFLRAANERRTWPRHCLERDIRSERKHLRRFMDNPSGAYDLGSAAGEAAGAPRGGQWRLLSFPDHYPAGPGHSPGRRDSPARACQTP